MKMKLFALLSAACLLFAAIACAEEAQPAPTPGVDEAVPAEEALAEAQPEAEEEAPADEPEATGDALALTREYRWFVNQYGTVRGRTVTYYDNVYAVNHGEYGLTPFSDVVPSEYFVADDEGYYAVAPIVVDITNAMRYRLYGGDIGELGLLYGQYCERVRGKGGRVGFSGIHEGIDFIAQPGQTLHAILGGEVTRAGDSNGTVAIYNAARDVTVLYLHCENISVRRGDKLRAGDAFATEGKKGSGGTYTHVELRDGRHTSSSAYRDTKIESDCPYSVMRSSLGVRPSGREALTYAAALELKRQQEAEAAALLAEAQALEAASTPEPEPTPDVELVDALPGTQQGYGFADADEDFVADPTPAAAASPAPEATLPPANP